MNFVRFQYLTVFLSIVLLLNGCVSEPRDERVNYLSKRSLSNRSPAMAYDTTATTGAGYHIVQQGETLSTISRYYGFHYRDVAAWNNIYPPYTIWPGQQLLIYTAPVVSSLSVNQYPTVVPASYHSGITPLSYQTSGVVPVNYSNRRIVPLSYSNSGVVPVNYGNSGVVPLSYYGNSNVVPLSYGNSSVMPLSYYGNSNVVPLSYYNNPNVVPLNYGSSYVMPLHYRTSTALPVYYNTPSAVIHTQGKSALGVPAAGVSTKIAVPASNFHTARRGESLSSIATLYGLTVYELALWNDITSPYTVHFGQQLLIVEP